MITQQRCRQIFEAVESHARRLGAPNVEAMIGAGRHALTRFANNAIHQNVADRSGYLSVRALLDQRTARATTNRLDQDSIRRVVEEAVAVTRLQEPDPQLQDLAEPGVIPDIARHFVETAGVTPEARAKAVAEAIRVVEDQGQTAAGIFSNSESVFAILNSRGLFAYHPETIAVFSITAMGSDSSGWAKASACRASELNPVQLARAAAGKAAQSASPRLLDPGKYTVILEPAAVLDLVGQIFGDFSATALRDGRSFLGDRLGTNLFGHAIQITDDVTHPMQSGAPFDGEGVRRCNLILVEDGIPREIAYSRQAAAAAGAQPTGHGFPLPNEIGEAPGNIVIQGGAVSIDQMIASTERGILVTRLWYIREVDPYEKIMTGMTRDGAFLIERGELRGGVRNFRFNQSVIDLLKNVEALSPSCRASGEEAPDMVVPAMKAHEFNFTEVTKF
jgi:predicted Zn-dependent protease